MLINLVTYYSFSTTIIILIITSFFLYFVIMKNIKERQMHKKTVELLENSFSNYNNYSLTKNLGLKQDLEYDYVLTIKSYTYYIKLLRNFSNAEIHVLNKSDWQMKTDGKNKTKKLISGVEKLIDKELDNETNTNIFKLFVVYPDARRLLLYKDECELIFIEPNTNVYSTNVITHKELSDNIFILDKTANRKN